MLIIGLLLLLLAAAVIAYMVLATAGMAPIHLDYGILNVQMEPLWLFLAGAATVAVFAIGLWLAVAGTRSKARQAREVRELRKQAKTQDRRAERAGDSTAGRTGGSPTNTPMRPPASSDAPASTPSAGGYSSSTGSAPGGTRAPGATTGTTGHTDPEPGERSRLDLDR